MTYGYDNEAGAEFDFEPEELYRKVVDEVLDIEKCPYEAEVNLLITGDDEIREIEGLYKVYNLEYINNMILAFLELVLRVLQIVAGAQGASSKSSSSN